MLYPVGIQTFAEVRTKGYVYVDKTAFIPLLLNESKYIFLSRPRRFGKSLTLSTLEAYFSGRKELFDGLAIAQTEREWKRYPVMHLDFNIGDFTGTEGLRNRMEALLDSEEAKYGIVEKRRNLSDRFEMLITEAHRQTGEQVVILIDEYEKPILEAIGNSTLQDQLRDMLKPFFGCLKTCDPHIRFAMLTGVTKYGHLNVFSDLNNIADISLEPKFADICGITHEELKYTFAQPIHEFALEEGLTDGQLIEELVRHYDSYRFSRKDVKVFNPYSLLKSLQARFFDEYWFMSGTPSFLIRLIQDRKINLVDLEGYEALGRSLTSIESEQRNAIPVLYQSGYLTIKHYDRDSGLYTLGYPNLEVRKGFLNSLMEIYNGQTIDENSVLIESMNKAARKGHPEVFMQKIEALFAGVPYSQDQVRNEYWFRDMVYMMFSMLGYRLDVERHISTGRLDCAVLAPHFIYLFEFKYGKTVEEALTQIEIKEYVKPYLSASCKIYKIGVNYNPVSRHIEWRYTSQSD